MTTLRDEHTADTSGLSGRAPMGPPPNEPFPMLATATEAAHPRPAVVREHGRPSCVTSSDSGQQLSCGTRLLALSRDALLRELSHPSLAHRVIVPCRGHQRVVWHGTDGVEVAYLRRGSILVLPAAARGRVELAEDTGFYCINVAQDRLAIFASALGHATVPETLLRIGMDDARTASIVELLGESIRSNDAAVGLIRGHAVDLLCLQLIRHHSSVRVHSDRKRRGLASWHIRKISEFVDPRLASPLTLDDLASQAGLSRYHFCTAFKAATGVTPNEWLTTKRINRAAMALVESNVSIADIALSVGYETPSAFSACFRRVMGCTPSSYRRDGMFVPAAWVAP